MGYISHKVFVVTAGGQSEATEKLEQVRNRILEELQAGENNFTAIQGGIDQIVTPIVRGLNNHYSFAILPDGSSEGWPTSHLVDVVIERAISLIKTFAYKDGSNPLSWGLMCFKDDYGDLFIQVEGVKFVINAKRRRNEGKLELTADVGCSRGKYAQG